MKTCPRCKGRKVQGGYACPGFKYVEMKCSQCKGMGQVPDEMSDWMAEGGKRREERMSRDMSLGEEARSLGISAVLLSQAERGVIDPATVKATK